MKIEWGKKVCCPACSLVFYDLWKTSLVCPYCGNTFSCKDLILKNANLINAESDEDISAKPIGVPDFEFEDEIDNSDTQEDIIEESIDNLNLSEIE